MKIKKLFRFSLKICVHILAFYHTLPFLLKVSVGLLNNFFSSSVSFNLDTLYLDWNTSFPAITVCEIYNAEKIWDLSETEFGEDHSLLIDDFVSEIVFYRGTCSTCDKCDEISCPANFTRLLELFRSKCKQLIINCSYINKFFDCCEEFLPIPTEYGICYSFNSHQARKNFQAQYTNNRITGAGYLRFNAAADIQLHVHAPIDVPFLYSEGMIRETVLLGAVKEMVLNVVEVFNHESIYDLTLDQRRCRYMHERTALGEHLGIYEYYSYSTCVVECTVEVHLEHCNCTTHFLTSPSKAAELPMCDYRGLSCLTQIYNDMRVERKSCDCMSSCDEPEYNIIYNSPDDEQEPEHDVSDIKVALVELPTQRYVRRVAKTNLDLLISVGGIVSLFFNTSMIRILELIFMLVEQKQQLSNFCKNRTC